MNHTYVAPLLQYLALSCNCCLNCLVLHDVRKPNSNEEDVYFASAIATAAADAKGATLTAPAAAAATAGVRGESGASALVRGGFVGGAGDARGGEITADAAALES